MRILFALAEPYLPYTMGGGVVSIHDYASQFRLEGHQCEVLSAVTPGPRTTLYRVLRFVARRRLLALADTKNGYVTRRGWQWLLPALLRERVASFYPDVVICQGTNWRPLAAESLALGLPTLVRVNFATFVDDLERAIKEDSSVTAIVSNSRFRLVATSRFIANRIQERLRLEAPVAYPVIRREHCVGSRAAVRRYVTLINPTAVKGLSIALDIAGRLPQREFLFVESWPMSATELQSLTSTLTRLPNVTFQRWTGDLRDAYSLTKVLLVPSQCEDAFPRVVLEAALNGIPTVGSDLGGVPEAVADSGCVLPADAAGGEWAAAVERVLTSDQMYNQLTAAASRRMAHSEFDPSVAAKALLRIASSVGFNPSTATHPSTKA